MPPEPPASKARLRRKTSRREPEEYRFDGSHAREIEQKRNNGQISCAECRRLKIKCDKQIPCQSCQRRGCAALCPNGTLATGQGTRFVLAATEHLHRRISKMGERIRQLEDALGEVQSRLSSDPHPLLRVDLLGVGQRDDEDDAGILGMGVGAGSGSGGEQSQPTTELWDTFGTLSITDHGIARFFGPTGGSESDTVAQQEGTEDSSSDPTRDSQTPPLPQELQMFSQAFPFTPMGPVTAVREVIESHLPSVDRARYLVQTYLDQAGWLFHGVPREQIVEELLPVYYTDGPLRVPEESRNPHDLALLFLLFAIGALVDLTQEPGNCEAEHYHQIARAAICLQPVLEKPSLVTIQVLHLLSIYNALSGNELTAKETSMETTWSLVTLAAHLAQTSSVVLDRDSARWNLPDKVVQRRRVLFWDLFVADAWNSLHTGRPPSFSRAYVDCRYPQSPEQAERSDTEDSVLFESWGYRFAAECVADVAARTLTAEAPSFATIMDLDRKVREFPIPVPVTQILSHPSGNLPTVNEDMSIAESMSRFVMTHSREVILLYTHRSFFAQAIMENPTNPLTSQYAQSFLATYRASSTILRATTVQFALQPLMCTRFWSTWTFAFSAAIVFGTIVTRGPRSPLATDAMKELDDACLLFTKAAAHNRRAAKALPILTKLSEKAHVALATSYKDVPSVGLGQPWIVKEEEEDDELSIFAGMSKFVTTKRLPNSASDTTRAAASCKHGVQEQQQPAVAPMYRAELPPPPPTTTTALGVMDGGWGPGVSERYPLRSTEYPETTMRPPLLPPPPSQASMVPEWRAPPPSRRSDYTYTNGGHQHDHHLPAIVGNAGGAEPVPSHPSHTWSSDISSSSHPFRTTAPANFGGSGGSHAGYHPPPPSHGATYNHALPGPLPAPSSAPVYHNHEHDRAHEAHAHPPHQHTSARPAPSELAELGLISQGSRLDERWTSFVSDPGYFEGYRGR
ncbi:hypothetical protein F5I97DRAFT_1798533 [Phlebopus sp. FC_14]|nr:hypothetical protein F5I97DRAFT_1798533 [Phlebopus sp. FC_14]